MSILKAISHALTNANIGNTRQQSLNYIAIHSGHESSIILVHIDNTTLRLVGWAECEHTIPSSTLRVNYHSADPELIPDLIARIRILLKYPPFQLQNESTPE